VWFFAGGCDSAGESEEEELNFSLCGAFWWSHCGWDSETEGDHIALFVRFLVVDAVAAGVTMVLSEVMLSFVDAIPLPLPPPLGVSTGRRERTCLHFSGSSRSRFAMSTGK
jgi:hypothetical protein